MTQPVPSATTRGTPGDEEIVGTRGADNINAGNGDDVVRGGAGDDVVRGGNGDDEVRGGSGDDDVRGGFGDDFVSGGQGDDVVNGGLGDDTLAGGRGEDVFVYDGAAGAEAGDDVVLDFDDGTDLILLLNAQIEEVVQDGDDTRLELSSGGSLTLQDFDAADFSDADLIAPSDFFGG